MNVQQWLHRAVSRLTSAHIPSSRLDAELLLAHSLNKSREYLLAHPEIHLLEERSSQELEKMLVRRMKREPVAYILGSKDFYGRTFVVTPDVLIPRPESEMIIDILKELPIKMTDTLIDIGTGSGALAVTIRLEVPFLKVVATDYSGPALAIAQKNALLLDAEVIFEASNLLQSPYLPKANFLVANLPYVDRAWDASPETRYEPGFALYAADQGLSLIKKLITQAPQTLENNGYLILEADPRQHNLIVDFSQRTFCLVCIRDFIVVLQKK